MNSQLKENTKALTSDMIVADNINKNPIKNNAVAAMKTSQNNILEI